MRAILILILVSALNQVAQVECTVNSHQESECGTIWKCFVPEKCVTGYSGPTIPLSKVLKTMDHVTAVHDDCPAIFRYHAYDDNWVHVKIESFNLKISSVLFITTDQGDNTATREFSCTLKGGIAKGVFRRSKNDKDKRNVVQESASDMLKCSFDVKVGEGDHALAKDPNNWNAQFKITDDKRKEESTIVTTITAFEKRCNPKNIRFNEGTNRTRKYTRILFEPEKYHCEEPVSSHTLEYKTEGTSDYKSIKELGCEDKQFTINTVKIIDESIEARCFAETAYLCNYAPEALLSISDANKQLELTPPVIGTQKSELKCPDGYYLITSLNEIPIKNPKFECLDHGFDAFWTFKDIPYKDHGRKASCTNEIQCNLMRKISEPKNGGQMDSIGFPECFESGTLHVSGKKVADRKCDTRSGIFKYSVEGSTTEKDVDDDTEFECRYPVLEDKETDMKRGQIVSASQAGIIAVAVILGIGIIIAGVILSRRSIKKRKEHRDEVMKRDDAAWNSYIMTAAERKEYDKKKAELMEKNEVVPDSVPCEDPSKLSVQMMSKVFAAQNLMGTTTRRFGAKPKMVEFDYDDAARELGLRQEKFECPPSKSPAHNEAVMNRGGLLIKTFNNWIDAKEVEADQKALRKLEKEPNIDVPKPKKED